MAILTDRSLRRKWAGKDEWLSDGGSRGAGRLVAKLSAGGIIFYFQYYISGRRRFLQIGPYDPKSERGQTLLEARDQAQEWSLLIRSGMVDLHGFFADQERERQRAKEEAVAEGATSSRGQELIANASTGFLCSPSRTVWKTKRIGCSAYFSLACF